MSATAEAFKRELARLRTNYPIGIERDMKIETALTRFLIRAGENAPKDEEAPRREFLAAKDEVEALRYTALHDHDIVLGAFLALTNNSFAAHNARTRALAEVFNLKL